MDNQIQNTSEMNRAEMPQATPQNTGVPLMPSVEPNKPKKSFTKVLLFMLVAVAIGSVGFYGYENPQLFRAAVTESVVQPVVPTTSHLYIPDYDTSPVDSGKIAIRTTNGAPPENLVSMEFKLKYSPVNALEFNQDSLVFDNDTLFKSADLKRVDASVPGEVSISFFSSIPVSVTADDQTLVKLALNVKGSAGSTIKLSAEDVSLVEQVAGSYSVSNTYTMMTGGTLHLMSQSNLRVLSAEALDSTHVLVRFSDLLSSRGTPAGYTFFGGLTATYVEGGFGSVTYPGLDQSTVIVTTTNQSAGAAYGLDVTGVSGNVQGDPSLDYNHVFFEGYQLADGSVFSPITISSVDSLSSTKVRMSFTGAVNTSTVTPVNVVIRDKGNSLLTVTNLTMGTNALTAELDTANQKPDAIYFVSLANVTDVSNHPIANNTYKSFFGYSVPGMVVNTIKPDAVVNDRDQAVVAIGSNLNTVKTVRVGTTEMNVTEKTSGALTFIVPKDFKEGVYDVVLVNEVNETKTLKDGLSVSGPKIEMRIVSEDSKAIPAKVAPDGTTEVTFWVLVEDPIGLANIDSVTIDLEQIGGNRAQEMQKDTGLQQKGKQFYTFKSTVSAQTTTQATPYKLPVEVRKGSQVAEGTVDITVTKDVLKSVPPTVDQVYVSPSNVSPDGKTNVKVSAKVSDLDGADTIKSVVADLGQIGAGFVVLKDLAVAGEANEQITGWFESDEFTVPVTTKEGNYRIIVTASDATGETATGELTLEVSSSLSGPNFDKTKTYFSPTKSVVKDGKTPFSIQAMVSDQDGVSDIDSVTAYFSTLGMKPVTLLKDPNASEGAKSGLFASGDLVVPTTSPLGVHEVELVAVDKTGGKGNLIMQLDVTYKDTLGDAPLVFSKQSYASPKVAVNDGKTAVTLYAFVRDDDDDLDTVAVNLSGIGQVGQQTPPDFASIGSAAIPAQASDGPCATNSTTLVCMQPGFKEGRDGQWFMLPGVTISTETPASSTPYEIEVIATDKRNKVSRGKIELVVQDSQSFEANKAAPALNAAVASAPGKIELVFSEELSALSLASNGSDFRITESADVSKTLTVYSASINAQGNIVTLTTDSLDEGKQYVLTAGGKLTDTAGMKIAPNKNRVYFTGFKAGTKTPVVEYISGTDPETVEVEFQEPIRPTSVKLGTSTKTVPDFDFRIFEADNPSVYLAIKSVQFGDSGSNLIIKTAPQRSGVRYRLQLSGIASANGSTLKQPISKVFKAINISYVKQARVSGQADLNGDGKVDFIDFTMFSAVYGKAFGLNSETTTQSQGTSTSPSPITPAPDSTVPHTSVPTGGTTPAN